MNNAVFRCFGTAWRTCGTVVQDANQSNSSKAWWQIFSRRSCGLYPPSRLQNFHGGVVTGEIIIIKKKAPAALQIQCKSLSQCTWSKFSHLRRLKINVNILYTIIPVFSVACRNKLEHFGWSFACLPYSAKSKTRPHAERFDQRIKYSIYIIYFIFSFIYGELMHLPFGESLKAVVRSGSPKSGKYRIFQKSMIFIDFWRWQPLIFDFGSPLIDRVLMAFTKGRCIDHSEKCSQKMDSSRSRYPSTKLIENRWFFHEK